MFYALSWHFIANLFLPNCQGLVKRKNSTESHKIGDTRGTGAGAT